MLDGSTNSKRAWRMEAELLKRESDIEEGKLKVEKVK